MFNCAFTSWIIIYIYLRIICNILFKYVDFFCKLYRFVYLIQRANHFVIDHFFTIQILALIFNSSCFINWIFEERGKKVLKRVARDHPVRVSIFFFFFFFYGRQFSPFILFHHWHNAAGIRSGIITHGVCLTPRKVIAHDLRRGEVHISWSPCFSGSVAKSSSSRFVVSFFLSFFLFFPLSFYLPLSSSSTTVFSPRHAPLMRFRASRMYVHVCVYACVWKAIVTLVFQTRWYQGQLHSRFIRWFVIIEITVSRIRYSWYTYMHISTID